MELYTSNIHYNGKTYNNDCFSFCKYETDTNDIIQFLLDEASAVCSLVIPTCFTDTGNLNTVSIIENNTTSSILQSLLYQVCSGQIKVSSTDMCMGWLSGKLTSTDGSIEISTITDGDGCQTLDLSVNVDAPTVDTSIVLYANTTDKQTVSPNFTNQLLHHTSIPANTFVTNGDSIVVETMLQNTNYPTNSSVQILIGPSEIYQTLIHYSGAFSSVIKFRLTRISTTELYMSLGENIFFPSGGGFPIVSQANIVSGIANVLLAFDIQVKTDNTAVGPVKNKYLIIDKFKA